MENKIKIKFAKLNELLDISFYMEYQKVRLVLLSLENFK